MSALQLETAAALLGPLLDEVVFVGGATVHLWITEPGAPPTRATEDIDVVCEVATRVKYHRLGDRLRERGLQEAIDAPVICRWRSADPQLVLDVMPTDPDILGFSNLWYEEAISSAVSVALGSGAEIRAAAPAALVATKLCAWKGRGGDDLLRSLDIHDVLALVDGRPELIEEVASAPPDLRRYVRDELSELHAHDYFDYAVEGATAAYGPAWSGARPPCSGPHRRAPPLSTGATSACAQGEAAACPAQRQGTAVAPAQQSAGRAIPEAVSPGGGLPRRSGGTIWAGIAMPKPDSAELNTFLGPVADRDAEVIERWREAPAEDHAQAMIELSRYAERMAIQTGIGKDQAERFPGIPEPGSPTQQAA